MRSKLALQIRFHFVTLCAVSLALGAVSVVAAEANAASQSRGSLLLFGSSSINDTFGHLISEDLARLGFIVARHGYSSAGLARPDFRDLRDALAQLPIERNLSTVLFYVGANDAQTMWLRPEERRPSDTAEQAPWVTWEDARWSSVYEARVTELLRSVCDRGAKRAILLAPVDVANERMQSRLDRIRQLQAHAASTSECGHFVPTAGDTATFQSPGPGEPLRAADGYHMTRTGAIRVWERVRGQMLSLLASG
ncbi:MAG: hypothetical protein ABW321_00555 [Polyangiales bacterium]